MKRRIVAVRLTTPLARRMAKTVNFYLGRYPMADFPTPFRAARVAMLVRFA